MINFSAKRFWALPLILGIILLGFTPLYGQSTKKYAVVKASSANIRSAPSKTAAVLYTVSQGERLEVLEDLGLWLKVRTKSGIVGFVYSSLLEVVVEKVEVPESPPAPKVQPTSKNPPVPSSGAQPTVSKKRSLLPLYIAGGLAVAGATAYVLFRKGGILNPGTATLRVNSNPSQADFYIDGEKKCTTPCTVENVSPGKHQLKLVKELYGEWSKEMKIKGYREYDIEAELSPYGYEEDFCFGSSGHGNGQFDWPQYITVDDHKKLYVTDYRNYRVQKFDLDGSFLGKIDLGCQADGIKFSPKTGKIYVSSYCRPEFLLLTRNLTIAAAKSLGHGIEWGIGIDDDGNLYVAVADSSHDKILISDPYGNYKSEFSVPSGSAPYDVEYGNGKLYVALSHYDRVAIYSTSGRKEGELPEIYAPYGVALDKLGYVYASSSSKVYKFTPDGKELLSFGDFNWPQGMVVLEDGTMFIVDSQNNRVCKWLLSNKPISTASAKITVRRRRGNYTTPHRKTRRAHLPTLSRHIRPRKIRK